MGTLAVVKAPPRVRPLYTYEQYIGLEQVSSTKHEFFDGEIYAMAGGSADHAALAANTTAALVNALTFGPCQAYSSDLRIYVEALRLAAFPDLSVLCEPVEQHVSSPEATALNPTVLVEVTSDSSENYDRTLKLDAYRTIPSLRDYVIISHRERRITVHTRGERNWSSRDATAGERIAIASIQAELVVDTIYRKTSVA